MAAVCRCFPGKRPNGGDRVPTPDEIENCSSWLDAEIEINRPQLVIAAGKLAATAIEYPPMQDPASFNLDAIKKKIDEAIRTQRGQ